MRTIQNSILLLLFCTFSSIAQENDFQTWSSFSANKKIIKNTRLSVKTGLRLRENSSLYSKLFTDLKIKSKYNKHFSFAIGYRFSNDWNKQLELRQKNRFYSDIYYKDKYKKRFLFDARARLQIQGNIEEYAATFRHKSALAYNIPKTKLEPSVALEYFLPFENMLIDKLRYTIGLSHPITKDLNAKIAYRIQKEFYANNPETLFIFEGKLAYDL
jgi:hypothetical protein